MRALEDQPGYPKREIGNREETRDWLEWPSLILRSIIPV
jgi:hypothetical protein